MKYYFLVLIIYTVNVSADNQVSASEYARGIELVTEQQAAIYKFPLPEEVYKYVTKKDLSDIRVFNQHNEPVPHAIRRSQNKLITNMGSIELPYFPLPAGDVNKTDNGLDITVSNDGKVIRIQSENEPERSHQKLIKYYLIDTSHIKKTIGSLDFQLVANETNYAKRFKLEYSNDLNQWLTLVNRSTLTHLEYGDYILKNTHVDLPNKKIKYLRFTWLDESNGLEIESIKANFRNQYLSEEEHWAKADLINKNNDEGVYEFDTGGVFNIEQLDIELPEDNMLIDVIIESRSDKQAHWQRRFSGVFYKLYLHGTEITGTPVSIRPTKDRFWRIKLQSIDGIGQAEPVMKYGWRSNDLYFLARGESPYILAYGNANITQISRPTSRLMNVMSQSYENEMVGVARAGREIMFKGDAALSEQFVLPWERIALWLVLIIGVIVIAVMVFRLSRQMRNDV